MLNSFWRSGPLLLKVDASTFSRRARPNVTASSMNPRAWYHRQVLKGKRRAGERGKRDGLPSPSSPSSFLQRTTRSFLLQLRPCWVGSVSECNVPTHFGGRCEMASTLQGPLGGSQTSVATYTQGSSHDGARGSPLRTPRGIVPGCRE